MPSFQCSQCPIVCFCDLGKYTKDEIPADPDPTSSQSISSSHGTKHGDVDDTVDLNGLDEERELDDDLWGEVDTEEEEND